MPAVVVALAAAALVSQANLAKLVLKPTAVGSGYVLLQRNDGRGTAQRTLDLCGTKNYPSESLRTDRIQVDYLKQGAKLALSNEVVSYRDDGAKQAMREVLVHARTCPNRPIAFEGQPPLTYKITRISDAKLLGDAVALRIDVSGKINGKRVSAIRFAIYQRVGNVLSGVYSYSVSGVPGATQQRFVLHAAEASAKALQGQKSGGLPA
jgi:hypothetical protein